MSKTILGETTSLLEQYEKVLLTRAMLAAKRMIKFDNKSELCGCHSHTGYYMIVKYIKNTRYTFVAIIHIYPICMIFKEE